MSKINTDRQTAREAAWLRQPLDGVDAQTLEGALRLTEGELKVARDEIDRLREREYETTKKAFDSTVIASSLSKSVEQRTKDAVWESILENCEPKTEYGPHGQHIEWYTADDIEQAINSVEVIK